MTPQKYPYQDAPKSIKRYRSNPVEVAIFTGLLLVFAHSAYEFTQNPSVTLSQVFQDLTSRTPASELKTTPSSPTLPGQTLNLKCEDQSQVVTTAKVRMSGNLCLAASDTFGPLTRATVTNVTAKTAGNVFADTSEGRFSTDFITLMPGTNEIHFEFSDSRGKTIQRTIQLMKN